VQVVAKSVENLLEVYVRQQEGQGTIRDLVPPMPTWYESVFFSEILHACFPLRPPPPS